MIIGQGTFRSLRVFNYRLWAAGALVSNVGTWMQRTAQDWLVLTRLTPHSATAVGVVMGLQFGPMLLLLPWAGAAADRFDRRRLLLATQAAMGLFALVLGLLTVTGAVRLWHVYLLAFLSGCASAVDAPARQTFVADLVDEADLPNAVALNSMSFNLAGMVGPAVAGMMIAAVGTGWAFLLDAASFGAVLLALQGLRIAELRPCVRSARGEGGLREGLRYVAGRPDLMAMLWMLLLIGTFGLNFPIFISTMSLKAFHGGPGQYGVLLSMMAVGTLLGALLAAGRGRPGFRHLGLGAFVFGLGFVLAALATHAWMFGAMLVVIGISALTFTNATSSLMQLSTAPAMRGRVMALRLAVAVGTTPLGAPLVGWVADVFGPRTALCLGAASGLAAAGVALRYLMASRGLHLRWREGRLGFGAGGAGQARGARNDGGTIGRAAVDDRMASRPPMPLQ